VWALPVDISVVVCTRNRAPQLKLALESLARLQYAGHWELVIVDNGSTDDTQRVIEEFGKGFDRPLRTVYERQPGLGHARNIGLQHSTCELVAFTDDDCYPEPDWLQWIDRRFTEYPELGYIGGKVPLFDPADLPIAIQTSTRPQWLEPHAYVRPGQIPGANMAFRRAILLEIGGFDARFGAGAPFCAEDVEVQARVSAAGWRGYYEPQMVVHHHHRRRQPDDAWRLDLAYDLGRGAYYMKCLKNPVLRPVTLRHWYWAARHQSFRTTARELRSALRFLMADFRHRPPPVPLPSASDGRTPAKV
jgi:glycosyltransferase involved in cell wall biosynthesis